MNRMTRISTVLCAAMAFYTSSALATKPGNGVNPNGFPSGEHFNLNIHGKKEGFIPPVQEYDGLGNPVYGNSIFVPENGEGIEIYMQSGSGRKTAGVTELQVIDAAAGFDGDGAILQMPNNANGYRVYARALATPTCNPGMTITPGLAVVEDEYGNDLLYLGLVRDNGFESANGMTITRSKGKSKAIEITGLFEWSGDVCYFKPLTADYILTPTCCLDADGDLVYESCQEPVVVEGTATCDTDAGYEWLEVYCQSYNDAWVFNIADFVEYLWSTDNSGSKLVQIRFYPD